jgi:hypothetical protein
MLMPVSLLPSPIDVDQRDHVDITHGRIELGEQDGQFETHWNVSVGFLASSLLIVILFPSLSYVVLQQQCCPTFSWGWPVSKLPTIPCTYSAMLFAGSKVISARLLAVFLLPAHRSRVGVSGPIEAASNVETSLTQLVQNYTIKAQVRDLQRQKGVVLDRTERLANSLGKCAVVIHKLRGIDNMPKVSFLSDLYAYACSPFAGVLTAYTFADV